MYHVPVMLSQCIEALNIKPEGIYVDITFGGGGHSREILKQLTTGKLYAFDQDKDALENYNAIIKQNPIYKKKFFLIESNFKNLKKQLRLNGVAKIDGLLADLGVSSHQFDTADRGFSFRFEAELDMRMNTNQPFTARQLINEYSAISLQDIFSRYGEIFNSKTLAELIVEKRAVQEITTTEQLKSIAFALAKRGTENKYCAQLFQALRIEVNEEMDALEQMLLQTEEVINQGGRMVIMTYHSLEDRPVKNYIKHGKIDGEAERDIFGNWLNIPFTSITRKPIEASKEEVFQNPRARSAKLRVAERN